MQGIRLRAREDTQRNGHSHALKKFIIWKEREKM